MPKRGQREAKRERAGKALDLRIAGASYRQIASQLSVTEATAFRDVQEELARLDIEKGEKAERLRDLMTARLEAVRLNLWPEVRKGNPKAAFAALKADDQLAKLHGLYAPVKTELTGKNGGPLAFEAMRDDELDARIASLEAALDLS